MSKSNRNKKRAGRWLVIFATPSDERSHGRQIMNTDYAPHPTRAEAHAFVQSVLDSYEELRSLSDLWRRGADGDTVSFDTTALAIRPVLPQGQFATAQSWQAEIQAAAVRDGRDVVLAHHR